jgi:hypothetical protein
MSVSGSGICLARPEHELGLCERTPHINSKTDLLCARSFRQMRQFIPDELVNPRRKVRAEKTIFSWALKYSFRLPLKMKDLTFQ